MGDLAQELVQAYLDDDHLRLFAQRLTDWLITDLNQSDESVPDFTESRAKALMRASNAIDDPNLHDFTRLLETDTAVRMALYDLLSDSGLAENEEVIVLAAAVGGLSTTEQPKIMWPALAIAAFAWHSNYPLYQLDPASPPSEYTPAGQLVKRAASWMRKQVQRSATERDKLARTLQYDPNVDVSNAPSLEQLPDQPESVAAPPHYRPPIPVNYPEVSNETIVVDTDEEEEPVETNYPVTTPPAKFVITEDDLADVPSSQTPTTRPTLRITHDQIEAANPPPRPTRPPGSSAANSSLGSAVQRKYGRRERLTNTRLRVIVQEVQDGEGLYGVQVHIECRGVKASVAGTTNRNGVLLCELPVRIHSGLTYDIDVTWPREFGGHVERKSITLHADKNEFVLPFYVRLS